MKLSIQGLCASLVIVLLALLPPILMTLAKNTSLAPGLLFLSVLFISGLFKHSNKVFRPNTSSIIALFVLFFWMALQHLFVGVWDEKSYLSIPALSVLILASFLCSEGLTKISSDTLVAVVTSASVLLFGIGALNILTGFEIGKAFHYQHPFAVFPFLEPSFYALFSGLFFVSSFALAKNEYARFGIPIGTVAIGMLLPNMTMFVYALIMLLILMSSSRFKMAVSFAALIFIIFFLLNTPYFLQKILISSSSENLSALVYLQGLQDARNALVSTSGLGLGFQMLGTQPPAEIATSIARVLGNPNFVINRQDGGFLAAKLIAEFGVLGVAACLLYLFYCVKAFFVLRLAIREPNTGVEKKSVIASAIILAFGVDLFVRGIGYFCAEFFIFFIAVFYLINTRRRGTISSQHVAVMSK